MAASGGFWAKGGFISALEHQVLSVHYSGVTAEELKGKIKEAPFYMTSSVKNTAKNLIYKAGQASWATKDPEYQQIQALFGGNMQQALDVATAKLKPGTMDETITMKQITAGQDEASLQAKATAVTAQGISFTNDEMQKLAAANGLTVPQMQAKLEAYKTAASVKQYKTAALAGTYGVGKYANEAPPGVLEPKALGDFKDAYSVWPTAYKANPTALSKQYSEWAGTLSTKDKNSVAWYTGSGAYQINEKMRSPTWSPEKFPNSFLTLRSNQLNKTLDSAPPVKKNMMLYRGFGNEAINKAVSSGSLVPGSKLIDGGFMSTSTNPGTAKNFVKYSNPVYYRIATPQGTTGGAFIKPLSSLKGENEFLFRSNKSFTVIGAHMQGKTAVIDLVPTEGVK